MSVSSKPRVIALLIALATAIGVCLAAFATQAGAQDAAGNYSTDFESPAFEPGSPDGQDGWSRTGNYDHEIEDISADTDAPEGFGSQTFRISNAITSGSFGDQTFSASVDNEAGETEAENDGQSGGDRQSRFEADFEFTSAAPADEQEGLTLNISPDRGDGARMSYVGLRDTDAGLEVFFIDYQSADDAACNTDTGSGFVETTVADSLDRSGVYTVETVMDFVDDRGNDVVRVTVRNEDGDAVGTHTGTSWEDYFRDCEETETRTVDSLGFFTRGAAQTANDGKGFYIDNLSIATSTPDVPEDCTITGTEEADNIEGTEGDDVICGLGGRDVINGNDGNDDIRGGEDNDTINGNAGDDTINGNEGADEIGGGKGDDGIGGGMGNDDIGGGNGADTLASGDGTDTLNGDGGNDFLNVRDDEGGDTARGGPNTDRCASDRGDREISCEG